MYSGNGKEEELTEENQRILQKRNDHQVDHSTHSIFVLYASKLQLRVAHAQVSIIGGVEFCLSELQKKTSLVGILVDNVSPGVMLGC